MEHNVIEYDMAERETEACVCNGGPTLGILKEVQKAYENRMELVDKIGGSNKLQMQVDVLRSWVSDLVSQNTLLARALEDMETEITKRLRFESRRHSEREMKRCVCGNISELKAVNEALQKENVAREREIEKLNKDMQEYEEIVSNLRNEVSASKYHTPEVSRKDAEVMAGMCCTGAECGDWEPVKDYSAILKEETLQYQERIRNMEENLKCSSESVRALRKANVALSDETCAMRRACAALEEQCRAATVRAQFKDDIIREMRRQLKQAKAKLKELSQVNSLKCHMELTSGDERSVRDSSPARSYESVTIACVRSQPARRERSPPRSLALEPEFAPLSDDCDSPRFDGSGDELLSNKLD